MEVFKDIVLQSPRYDWSVIEEYNRSHCDQGVSVREEVNYFLVPVLLFVRHPCLDSAVEQFVVITS